MQYSILYHFLLAVIIEVIIFSSVTLDEPFQEAFLDPMSPEYRSFVEEFVALVCIITLFLSCRLRFNLYLRPYE